MSERNLFSQWVRATCAGWALGVPLIAALALIGEVFGIGGVQVLVGLGMGAGIGLMQGRVMRSVLGFAPWFWSCFIGLGLPFLAVDIAKFANWNFPYYPYSCIVFSGLIVGVWQMALLRAQFQNTGWWIVGSILGWSLAAGLVGIADALFRSRSIRGVFGLIVYLGSIAAGGLLLGLVTGRLLAWLPRQKPEPSQNI